MKAFITGAVLGATALHLAGGFEIPPEKVKSIWDRGVNRFKAKQTCNDLGIDHVGGN